MAIRDVSSAAAAGPTPTPAVAVLPAPDLVGAVRALIRAFEADHANRPMTLPMSAALRAARAALGD